MTPGFKEAVMLKWSIAFFIIALIAGILGFTGIASGAMQIAQILFYIFLVLFLVSLLVGIFFAGAVKKKL